MLKRWKQIGVTLLLLGLLVFASLKLPAWMGNIKEPIQQSSVENTKIAISRDGAPEKTGQKEEKVTVKGLNTEPLVEKAPLKANDSLEDETILEKKNEEQEQLEIPTEENIEKNQVTKEQFPDVMLSDIDEAWLKQEVKAHRDQISKEDLEKASAIFEKIDATYLFELSEDGFTKQEKEEAARYLETHLPPEEVDIAWALFYKYIGLVE